MKNQNKNEFKTKDIFMVFTLAFITWFSMYFALPVLNYGWFGLPFMLVILGLIVLFSDLTPEQKDKLNKQLKKKNNI